jgi:Tfp pilus assembly protein PilZ
MTEERRLTRRQPLITSVVIVKPDGTCQTAQTEDVSPTGVFVKTASPLGLGWRVTVVFTDEAFGEHLKLSAQVARCRPTGVGLRLCEVGTARNAYLNGVRQLRARQPPKPPAITEPPPSFFTLGECSACGWAGSASRYVRKCPRCGAALSAAVA